MSVERATTTESIAAILASRWSPRSFDADSPIDKITMVKLFEAARWAPSCFNEQPWRYLFCCRFTDKGAWDKALACLAEGNQAWAKRAPLIITVLADTKFSSNDKPNRWGVYDCGAASENMCLQACRLGLAIHQMGGFDAGLVARQFSIPDRFNPIAMIALGYPGDPEQLNGKALEMELEPRSRRPIEEFVYANEWDNPFVTDTPT